MALCLFSPIPASSSFSDSDSALSPDSLSELSSPLSLPLPLSASLSAAVVSLDSDVVRVGSPDPDWFPVLSAESTSSSSSDCAADVPCL